MPRPSSATDRRFATKIDRWLIVVCVLTLAAPIGLTVVEQKALGFPIFAFGVLSAFMLWLVAGTTYIVTADALRVRSGPFRWRVPLATIRSVRSTYNPRSAPALSLDRLEIRHRRGSLLVSPRDKAAFVAALLARAPDIDTSGLWGSGGDTGAKTDDARASMRHTLKLIGGIQLSVAVFVAAIFYFGMRAPTCRVSPDALAISAGMSSTTVQKNDVVSVALADALPPAHKHMGFSAAGYQRGAFDVDGMGRADLFVTRDYPPYLVMRTRTGYTIVNFKKAAETRALYADVQRAWGMK